MAKAAVTLPPIRRAVAADGPACARIVAGWLAEKDWMPGDAPDEAALADILSKGLPAREAWVIGDPVAGYLSFEPETATIHGLYVGARGRGYGKALVDRVKAGRDFVQLWTHAPNTEAHRFYAREGFVPVETRPEGRGDGVPEIRMAWHRTSGPPQDTGSGEEQSDHE